MKPYEYRQLTPDEREDVLQHRREQGFPLHAPPHQQCDTQTYLLTGACFEHAANLHSETRRREFEGKLLSRLEEVENTQIFAWCVLPNHYHVVVQGDLAVMGQKLHRLHNGTSTQWNREDQTPGRCVWYRFFDRNLRTERLFHVALNYVHTNAVKHGYVRRAEDWPTCSARWSLDIWGRDEMRRRWREFPFLVFGKDWDY